jgi:membrane protease YdiL (CAAX protease family)
MAGAPDGALKKRDPLRVAAQVGLFVALFFFFNYYVCQPLLQWVLSRFAGSVTADLVAVLCDTWLCLRIFDYLRIVDLGLWWNRMSADNLAAGLLGGAGSACLVLAPPLLVGKAHIQFSGHVAWDSLAFVTACLMVGAMGEELLFRGYAFQVLLARVGPYATVIPLGVIFGLLHSGNPYASWLGLANTAGFGILFGYAYVRSRDLWLPAGLHFGWNFTLPLFGVPLSGLKIYDVTGHSMVWTAGDLWSGGEYGPEASVLTTAVLFALFVYLWKAPIRRQSSPLTGPPKETVCEPSRP